MNQSILLSVLYLILINSKFAFTQGEDNYKLIIKEETRLVLSGSTNVNKFSCDVFQQESNDTLQAILRNIDNIILFNNGVIKFNVNKINCGNKKIDKDLQKALKSKEFPFITFNLIDISIPENEVNTKPIVANITIIVAGVTKSHSVEFERVSSDNRIIVFEGEKIIDINSFDIIPPTTLMDLIQVKEFINIKFLLEMALLN